MTVARISPFVRSSLDWVARILENERGSMLKTVHNKR